MLAKGLPDLDINPDLQNLSKTLIGNQVELQMTLQQSAMNHGPSTTHEALWNMMELCKISIETLAKRTNTPKKKIRKIIHGEIDAPPAIMSKIIGVFERARPDLFNQ